MPPRTRIVGVGNALCGDDAAGLEVARRLRELVRAADVVEQSGEPAALLETLRDGGESVVLVDAVASGSPCGTIHRIDVSETGLPAAVGSRASTHGLGLSETVALGRALGCLPPQLLVYGIEGEVFDLGAPLSPEVSHAVETVVAELRRIVEAPVGALENARTAG